MIPVVPVDAKTTDWPRKVATAINRLIRFVETPQTGQVRYEAGTLEWWDGSAWQVVP